MGWQWGGWGRVDHPPVMNEKYMPAMSLQDMKYNSVTSHIATGTAEMKAQVCGIPNKQPSRCVKRNWTPWKDDPISAAAAARQLYGALYK